MSKIKLVVEIDERIIEYIKEKDLPLGMIDDLCRAAENGTPLPKGHGRLIDADKLDTRERGNNSQRTMWRQIEYIVRHAPTIVEADKDETDN